MGDMGDYWRDVKEHYRKQQNKYEDSISKNYSKLTDIAKQVGDHHRIGDWDFWWTGTVRNIKTGENISFKKFAKMYLS